MARKSLSRRWDHEVSIDGTMVALIFQRMPVSIFIEWERRYFEVAQRGSNNDSANAVEDAQVLIDWARDTFERYVSLPDGELDVDGDEITTGVQLFDLFGTDIKFVMDVINAVWAFHRFDGPARKKLFSQFASPTGSGAPALEAAGQTPERIAGSVESAGSVTNEDVAPAAEPMVSPSGATTT